MAASRSCPSAGAKTAALEGAGPAPSSPTASSSCNSQNNTEHAWGSVSERNGHTNTKTKSGLPTHLKQPAAAAAGTRRRPALFHSLHVAIARSCASAARQPTAAIRRCRHKTHAFASSERCRLHTARGRVRVRVRVRKEMTYAHNFRKTPNQMYVIGIWGKSGQGKTAHGTEF
jgi:hypothetical protein